MRLIFVLSAFALVMSSNHVDAKAYRFSFDATMTSKSIEFESHNVHEEWAQQHLANIKNSYRDSNVGDTFLGSINFVLTGYNNSGPNLFDCQFGQFQCYAGLLKYKDREIWQADRSASERPTGNIQSDNKLSLNGWLDYGVDMFINGNSGYARWFDDSDMFVVTEAKFSISNVRQYIDGREYVDGIAVVPLPGAFVLALSPFMFVGIRKWFNMRRGATA